MNIKQFLLIFVLTLNLTIFQNFTWSNFQLSSIDQTIRIQHAKELLGKSYSGSYSEMANSQNDISNFIFNNISEGLPEKFKSQALLITQTLIEQSEFYDLDPVFTLAIIKTESYFNPLAKGSFGEIGLMQVKPDTAEWIAKKEGLWWTGSKSLENPIINIKIGTAYVNYLRNKFDGHANKYLAAYNMGPLNVRRIYASQKKPKDYPLRVMKHYNEIYFKLVSPNATKLAGN